MAESWPVGVGDVELLRVVVDDEAELDVVVGELKDRSVFLIRREE